MMGRTSTKLAVFALGWLVLGWLVLGCLMPDNSIWAQSEVVGEMQAEAWIAAALSDGSAALEAQRPLDAERAYREVLKLQPSLLDAHRGLARSLAAQGRTAEATLQLGMVGESLLRAGRYQDASEILAEVVSWAPQPKPQSTEGSTKWLALLGRAAALAQDPATAVKALRRAVDLGESSLATHLYLASALWDAGEIDASEELYRELAAPSGAPFLAIFQLGRLLRWRGDVETALPWLRRAQQMRPQAADVAVELAAASGEVEDWRRAVELAPDGLQAAYGLARSLARSGDRGAAQEQMEVYRQLYAAAQDRTRREGMERARLDHGWQLLGEGEYAAAQEHFLDFSQSFSRGGLGESAEALAGLAQAQSALGEVEASIRTLERALRLEPEREDLRQLLAAQRAERPTP